MIRPVAARKVCPFAAVPLVLWCSMAGAQQKVPATQFVAERQPEVERLGQALYSTRLDAGTWTRHELPRCPMLTHHAFARFDRLAGKGDDGHFLAFYDLDHPPAPSAGKPWRGGIVLLRLYSRAERAPGSTAEAASVVSAFNHVLQQERQTRGSPPTRLENDTVAVAQCFAAVSGQDPARLSEEEAPAGPDPAPTSSSTVLVPLGGKAGFNRTQYVTFDKRGFITEAGVIVQHLAP